MFSRMSVQHYSLLSCFAVDRYEKTDSKFRRLTLAKSLADSKKKM